MGYMPVLVASGFFVLIHHSATGTQTFLPAPISAEKNHQNLHTFARRFVVRFVVI